jgi:hypothetical protein
LNATEQLTQRLNVLLLLLLLLLLLPQLPLWCLAVTRLLLLLLPLPQLPLLLLLLPHLFCYFRWQAVAAPAITERHSHSALGSLHRYITHICRCSRCMHKRSAAISLLLAGWHTGMSEQTYQ